MKNIAILLFVLLPLSILAQECDCKSTLDWTKKTFEKNDAGFQYIIDKKGEQSYALHNKIYSEKITSETSLIECEKLIREWLSYFRKEHVQFHNLKLAQERAMKKANEVSSVDKRATKNGEETLHNRYKKAKVPFIEQINASTLYLRIPSFLATQRKQIDSVISSNFDKITTTENLIIDIRNGTGGDDTSYQNLLPLLYTNPIRTPATEFLSTTLNNQRMYEMSTNSGVVKQFGFNPTQEEMETYKENYETLNKHLGEFVNLEETDVTIKKFDKVYEFPKTIGVLINHKNASTDEQFLLAAKQSKKVKLFGTTTKGALDISNLYLTYSPCKDYALAYAISKSKRIPDMAIDDTGIMPDYFIDKDIPEHEWIDYTTKILNN